VLIGEVARLSGVSARMLRHYDALGLVRPTGRSGAGYREYSGDDIRRIFHIESLRSLGLSLRDVGRALDDPGFTPSELVDDLIRQTRERIAAETELLTRLRRISAAEPGDWDDVLQVVVLLRALRSTNAGTRQRAALSSVEEAEAAVPVEALVEAVLGESDPNVAGALRWALARSGGRGALAPLAEGLRSPAAEVRGRAVRAIAELPYGDVEETGPPHEGETTDPPPGEATDLPYGGQASALPHGDPPAQPRGDPTALLLDVALPHPDAEVRRHAALALGARGVADAIPALVDMVVEEANDVDAADVLSALAGRPETAERIAAALVGRLAHAAADAPVRRRLTQALADIPGSTATRALQDLAHDDDRAVALTAAYVLTIRPAR
jgi:DNA-binding transcriptional MerR regulator